jgi:trimeric autotransporter adhesin
MKRNLLSKILLLSFFFLNVYSASAQWSGLGTGIADGANVAAYSMAVSGSDVYVGGYFITAGSTPVSNIAKWNSIAQTWSALGSGVNSTGFVYALAVFNGDLYAGGSFTNAGGNLANRVAKWNPITMTWSPLGTSTSNGVDGAVYALTVFGGKLFIGGFFNNYMDATGSHAAAKVVIWDGTNFTTAGSGPGGNVRCFAVHNAALFAGCATNVVSQWTGSTWTAIGNPSLGSAAGNYAEAMASFQGSLYASGPFTTNNNIAKWNGSTWIGVGTGFPAGQNAKALKTYNGSLYAGGTFTSSGGNASLPFLSRWTGSVWATTGTTPNQYVYSLDSSGTPGQTIYAGGTFTAPYSHIMKHVGVVGIDEETLSASNVKVYPNPAHEKINLYVNAEVKNPKVEIYNILGDKIYSEVLHSELQTINTKAFARGIYFVKIISTDKGAADKVFTQKLVIE